MDILQEDTRGLDGTIHDENVCVIYNSVYFSTKNLGNVRINRFHLGVKIHFY